MSNLRQRAAGTAVAERPNNQPGTPQTIQSLIRQMEDQFALAMPRGAEAKQLVRDAMTSISRTPKLAECDATSVLGALMTCAQLGLRPGVLGQAWVLPFYDGRSRSHKAQLVIGYQGLVELAHRSGRVASLIARTVYENDEFDVAYGLEDRLHHKPTWTDDPGEPIGYYAIVKLNTGGHAFVVMSKKQAEDHRDAHAMAKTKDGKVVGPWRDHFDAMAMKTCVIKLAKWMPRSTDLMTALHADEGVRFDLDPHVTADDVTHRMGGGEPEQITAQSQEETLRLEIRDAAQGSGLDVSRIPGLFAERFEGVDINSAPVEQLEDFLTAVRAGSYDPPEE